MRRLLHAVAVLLVGAAPLAGCIPVGGEPPSLACLDLLQPAGATTPTPIVIGVVTKSVPGCLDVSDQVDQLRVIAPPGYGIEIRCVASEDLYIGVQAPEGLQQIGCDATASGLLIRSAQGLSNVADVQVSLAPLDPPPTITEDEPYLLELRWLPPGYQG